MIDIFVSRGASGAEYMKKYLACQQDFGGGHGSTTGDKRHHGGNEKGVDHHGDWCYAAMAGWTSYPEKEASHG